MKVRLRMRATISERCQMSDARRRMATLWVATAMAMLATAPWANAEPEPEISPFHNISCKWLSVPPPYSSTSTAVAGFVQVWCTDRLDNANTNAQIQRYYNGAYRAHGTGVTSYSTGGSYNGGYLIHVADSAGKTSGEWYYRMRGEHFGQHGNIFVLPAYHSGPRLLMRS